MRPYQIPGLYRPRPLARDTGRADLESELGLRKLDATLTGKGDPLDGGVTTRLSGHTAVPGKLGEQIRAMIINRIQTGAPDAEGRKPLVRFVVEPGTTLYEYDRGHLYVFDAKANAWTQLDRPDAPGAGDAASRKILADLTPSKPAMAVGALLVAGLAIAYAFA